MSLWHELRHAEMRESELESVLSRHGFARKVSPKARTGRRSGKSRAKPVRAPLLARLVAYPVAAFLTAVILIPFYAVVGVAALYGLACLVGVIL